MNDDPPRSVPAVSRLFHASTRRAPRPAAARLLPAGRSLRAVARRFLPVAVALVVTAAYTVYSVRQWNTFTVKSWDLGIFTQMYESYAAGGPPIVAIKGVGYNLLGDHFHPLLATLTPLYMAFPHPLTLLVAQNACFGIAAGAVTWIGQRLLGGLAGAVVGLACGLSWGLQYAVDAQFHEIALAVPLLAASLAAVLAQRWRWACAFAALLPFVKEDLGLTVVTIGALLFMLKQRRLGVVLAGWGVLWFLVAAFVVLPLLNPEGEWAYSEYLTASEDAAPATGPPFDLFHPSKTLTMTLLVVATAGMLFRSPLVIVLAPTLAWRFLSSNESYWAPEWHYSAVLMPVVFLAAVDGIARARASSSDWERRWARAAPGAIGLACLGIVFLKPTPLHDVSEPGLLVADPKADAVHEVLEHLPEGATVLSDLSLMSYVAADQEVYWLGNQNPVPEYVLIGPSGSNPDGLPNALGVARERHPGINFELVVERAGYSLAKRTGDDASPPPAPEPTEPPEPPGPGQH